MDNDFEYDDDMEMPTPCQKCGNIFDLTDGYESEKWFPNTVICQSCSNKEDEEIERDNAVEDLLDNLSDAENDVINYRKRLKEEYSITAPDKTDLEKFIALYALIGIELTPEVAPFTSDEHNKGNQILKLTAGGAPLKGYSNFYSIIEFNPEGKFVSQGFWE